MGAKAGPGTGAAPGCRPARLFAMASALTLAAVASRSAALCPPGHTDHDGAGNARVLLCTPRAHSVVEALISAPLPSRCWSVGQAPAHCLTMQCAAPRRFCPRGRADDASTDCKRCGAGTFSLKVHVSSDLSDLPG